uniref:Putative secreted protein n=1 Tax=Anopheles darlingi TaxID=43151 RepID=A0A2M4D8J1_ANODA
MLKSAKHILRYPRSAAAAAWLSLASGFRRVGSDQGLSFDDNTRLVCCVPKEIGVANIVRKLYTAREKRRGE